MHERLVARLRDNLVDWLPELESASVVTVEALDQVTSFEAWNRLRSDQGLGCARAGAVMLRSVEALLGLPDSPTTEGA